MELNIDLIRTDGGTQSRVSLNEDTYLEYAEAMLAGATFPPVVVFHDGTDHWLADGFHRYFAVQEAGRNVIDAEVRQGTQRDARLFSLGVNRDHGLRRSNADKRKAVETMLNDAEWKKWSDRKIADLIGVSVTFVGSVRRPEVKKQRDDNRVASQQRKTAGCSPATPPVAPVPEAKPAAKKEAEDIDYFGPSEEEIAAAQAEAANDMTLLHKLIESDDKLKTAVEENGQLRAELSVVKLSRDGYMNRSAELISRIKSLKNKLKNAEAANA